MAKTNLPNLPKGINFEPASRFPSGFENLSDREKKYYKMKYIVREVRLEYGVYVRKDQREQKFLRIDS